MPALIAHHLHGLEVLATWQNAASAAAEPVVGAPAAPVVGAPAGASAAVVGALAPAAPYAAVPAAAQPLSEAARQAFLLGCQGPDPFFFVVFTPDLADWRQLGSRMHAGLVQQSLASLRRAAEASPVHLKEAMQAYVRGWLCHFTLDSLAHPYVYYYEDALISAGIPGLDDDACHEVHAQIEADLDASLLYRRRGLTIKQFKPTDEVLLGSDSLLLGIGRLYQAAAAEVFCQSLPRQAYQRSLKDMRLSYEVLYSPDGWRRELAGRLERRFRPHSLAQAVSHRASVGPISDFDNPGREPWVDPFTGDMHCSSFNDIFDDAVALATARQLLYTDAASGPEMVGTLNFEGSPLQQISE